MNTHIAEATWDDVERELFTPEEITASELRVALIGELIMARQEKGISQAKLGELTGIKQPVLSRIERGTVSPNLETVQKVLYALGKKLVISDIQHV